jgi:hypothetical protein
MDKPIRPLEDPTMTARSALIEMGKALAKELARGEAGGLGRMASAVMEQAPELVLDLLDLMVAENAKKRPNQGLSNAEQLSFLFFFYLVEGLDSDNRMSARNCSRGWRKACAATRNMSQSYV